VFHVISRLLRFHRSLADLGAATGEDLFDEVSQVVCQMVSIGYLPGLRGAFARSGGILLASVTADYLNLCVGLHPSLGRLRLPIGQEIDNLMSS
jgi:hypothetical protein